MIFIVFRSSVLFLWRKNIFIFEENVLNNFCLLNNDFYTFFWRILFLFVGNAFLTFLNFSYERSKQLRVTAIYSEGGVCQIVNVHYSPPKLIGYHSNFLSAIAKRMPA